MSRPLFNEHQPQLHELAMHDLPDASPQYRGGDRARQKCRDQQLRQARRRKKESWTRPAKEKKD